MTKLISFSILGFAWLFFIWLAFSFAFWDLNPANWNDFARMVCAFIGFFPPLFIAPQMWHD
jgi:hypothetical protein